MNAVSILTIMWSLISLTTPFRHAVLAKKISKKRYIVEQYFGLSHLDDGAYRARFTTIMKNVWDTTCRQMAFNLFRGPRLLTAT